MITPIFGVEARVQDNVTKIFNFKDIGPVLWIRLPEEVAHLRVQDVVDAAGNSISWTRENKQSWLYIDAGNLNFSIGHHQYQIQLIDPVTSWITYVYFSYIIQSDTPDKPYYYMGNYRDEGL